MCLFPRAVGTNQAAPDYGKFELTDKRKQTELVDFLERWKDDLDSGDAMSNVNDLCRAQILYA